MGKARPIGGLTKASMIEISTLPAVQSKILWGKPTPLL